MMRLLLLLTTKWILFLPLLVSLLNDNILVHSDEKAEGYCINNDNCDGNNEAWKKWTVNEFWSELDCETIFEEDARPIHNESTWMLLRGIYHGIVGPEQSSITPITHESGFGYKTRVQQNEKGRSVFADEDIAEGELIWYTRNTARFRTGDSYRNFLHSVDVEL